VAFAGLYLGENLVVVFGLIGLVTSITSLLNTGGIRIGEASAERKEAKRRAQAEREADDRHRAYIEDVHARRARRAERERLRDMYKDPPDR